jgi:hypothetical protein
MLLVIALFFTFCATDTFGIPLDQASGAAAAKRSAKDENGNNSGTVAPQVWVRILKTTEGFPVS